MTGVNSGCKKMLEFTLQKPLPWVVSLLRTNELRARHIFRHLDENKLLGQTAKD